MSTSEINAVGPPASASTFVLFPLGKKRFALPAEAVAELAQPDQVHSFPHTSPMMSGVLLRRGRIVPVCDIATVLVGPDAPARMFYLIALCRFGSGAAEWTALPVNGECALCSATMIPPTGRLPQYIQGLLSLCDEIVEVLDLESLPEVNA